MSDNAKTHSQSSTQLKRSNKSIASVPQDQAFADEEDDRSNAGSTRGNEDSEYEAEDTGDVDLEGLRPDELRQRLVEEVSSVTL